jgi:hypothetical protein
MFDFIAGSQREGYAIRHVNAISCLFSLSAEGCVIGTALLCERHVSIATAYLSDTSEPAEVEQGAVQWSTEHQFGVEFIRLGLEEQERLRAYAHELQTED